MRRVAGGRYVSSVAIVYHVGRVSGKQYATPVGGQVFKDRAVIPLGFGTQADWCQNIRAAGRGRIKSRGKEYEMTSPEVVAYDSIRPLIREAFSAPERINFKIIGFSHFLVAKAGRLS